MTDRDNQRIQIFDSNGKFLTQWTNVGGISTLFMTKDQRLWAGGILRDLKGNILTKLPAAASAHGTAASESGDVYLALLSGVVQKFVRR